MATYTVQISGSAHTTYAYVTINGERFASADKKTYTSKPTVSVYVGAATSAARSKSTVKLNNETVKSGSGTYNLSTDATTININFTTGTHDSERYYNANITTSGEPESGDDTGDSSGGEHYTNIGGTSREIEGGTVMVGGALGEIDSGLTLVDGVQRDITFTKPNVTISITGSGSIYASVVLNGTTYNSSNTLVVPSGTEITLKAAGQKNTVGTINVDGVKVNSATTYIMTVDSDINIILQAGPPGTVSVTTT